ncbi:arginine/serine-rich coiled-coil protein 2 isoform X2 [Periplaneta americana]|uniref:arginine/serine-rich coiled-coil protein 2 isoform X2 n=1 Tax=Periplaneta americana TaxID=6978 RepID=UPI0037E8E52E
MESLVGYGSDDESGENYQDIKKDDNERGMDRIRQCEEDVNYDNVQMDMSEESNNNHSGSSNEDNDDDDKSSTKSSSSRSSRSSDNSIASSDGERDKRGGSLSKDGKSGNGLSTAEVSKKREEDSRHRIEDRHKDKYSKGRTEKEKKDRHEHRNSREHNRRDYKEKEHTPRAKSRDRDRVRRDERRSKSHSRERDRERRRSRSRDRGSRKRSHSPAEKHTSSRHREEKRYKRSRSRERDRDRRPSPNRERQRSRSRERDRGKSSSSSSGSSRRGSYEKKPSKLTILERLGIELRPPEAPPAVTPQQLLQKSIEQQVQQVKTNTGIELPKYYNPAAMNPARYAEQMQKRKLLWGNKSQAQDGKSEEVKATQVSNNKWEGTTFAQDQDGKMTAKFKRLMGIKDTGGSSSATSSGPAANPEGSEILKKQEELFNSMEMQYEVARVATHTHRGVGLGFGTFQYPR